MLTGDQGSVLVVVNDEDGVYFVSYSLDMGKTWYVPRPCLIEVSSFCFLVSRDKVDIDIQFRARALTTVQIARED